MQLIIRDLIYRSPLKSFLVKNRFIFLWLILIFVRFFECCKSCAKPLSRFFMLDFLCIVRVEGIKVGEGMSGIVDLFYTCFCG